ncbi:hypothetical protein K438DRAFT_1749937 [Mycena galopus ATCC 62051]|nr:hypothetical protein K438DRAFT_1749937 [Mycena galopus ATCC 62051]
MSDGLLKNLNWDNVIVAGGIVLGVLLSVGDAGQEWAASDIDIYIHGLTPTQANDKICELFATFQANLPKGKRSLLVRNSKTITFYSSYPLRRIQIVLKLVKSPRAVLLNFDLDICAMCWDGNEFLMLPRAARALESKLPLPSFPLLEINYFYSAGYTVFTMNMIQGHYLSERRATQEQRVFKYADRGYGVRILPSYISSLEASKSKLRDISRDEILFGLDIEKIAAASRKWTRTVNYDQLSSEPQGRSCLSGFALFMRHIALWELEKKGEIVYEYPFFLTGVPRVNILRRINTKDWASTSYDSKESILTYDDTPLYKWDEGFNIPNFKRQIDYFNARLVYDWLSEDHSTTEEFYEAHGIPDDNDIFEHAARLTHAKNVTAILSRASNIIMPVVVPRNLAAYMNQLVGEAQEAAGLNVQPILTPAVEDDEDLVVGPDSGDSNDGLYMWRIGKETMWQQLDRRIDEVSEVLYAFYRVNDRIYGVEGLEDEFDAFARWIGRQPIFVDRFFNGSVQIENMEGQDEQYTTKYSMSDSE